MRGSIFWALLDKRRPVIIISAERRNQLARDVVVIPCSTNMRAMSWHVLLRKGEGGLHQASMAKCEQILTVPKDCLSAAPLGSPLSSTRVHELERAILRALEIVLG